ncbi:MAG: hypothetical protein EOO00_10815 [Chitinophagaceae bacterium]|nr:MAG: hypothetical protein EOO00_10815 [Chitinophagaceae bacterium]
MAEATLKVKYVTYVEGASKGQLDMMMKMGIGGMTGNKIFTNRVLILDTKNRLFAVVPGKRHKYHYENVPNDFKATIELDEEGFVTDYPALFIRTAAEIL